MSSFPFKTLGAVHQGLVLNRRVEVLSRWFAGFLPEGASTLDVGCGDGRLAAMLQRMRSDITIRGIDVLARDGAHIPTQIFDGSRIPFADGSFDVVLLCDVLHHTPDPVVLQQEAHRVARQAIFIKDHYREGIGAAWRLRFMDWCGNARFGVALPYNYWTEAQWRSTWDNIGLRPERLVTKLGLYPWPAELVFGAKLHFIAVLKK